MTASLSHPQPNPQRQGDRTIALTPKGHYAVLRSMGYRPDEIVWVPVVDLPWYEDKRSEAAS